MREPFDDLVRDTIAACDGTVIKGLGDGVMAVFESATGAIEGAVALQRAVDAERRAVHSAGLHVRMGLSVGDVHVDGDDMHGMPVVEAARLCDAADGDQILCRDSVRALAGSRSGARLVAVGALDLKGLPEPVGRVRDPVGGGRVSRATAPVPASPPTSSRSSAETTSGPGSSRPGMTPRPVPGGRASCRANPVSARRGSWPRSPGSSTTRPRSSCSAGATRASRSPTNRSRRRSGTTSITSRPLPSVASGAISIGSSPSFRSGSAGWTIRSSPTPTPNVTGCTRPSPCGSPTRRRRARSCSSSTTSSGRPGRPSSSCATCSGAAMHRGCS